MYNMIKYRDNYSDTSGSLWHFKSDQVPANDAGLTINGCKSIKYKTALVEKRPNTANGNSFVKNVKKVVPLKYLSNFWRSLEIPLINCKVYQELIWIENYVLSSARDYATFKITDTKSYAPVATLSTKDNVILAKQLNHGFNRSVY